MQRAPVTDIFFSLSLDMLDELASLSVAEAEELETGNGAKNGEALPDEPARWRPKVTLRRFVHYRFLASRKTQQLKRKKNGNCSLTLTLHRH